MKLRRLGIDERKGKTCATAGHEGRAATESFEVGGIGSNYCTACAIRLGDLLAAFPKMEKRTMPADDIEDLGPEHIIASVIDNAAQAERIMRALEDRGYEIRKRAQSDR